MTATVTELRAWKPDHIGDDPWPRFTRLNRQAIASQTPRHLTPVIPLPTDDDDDEGPGAA